MALWARCLLALMTNAAAEEDASCLLPAPELPPSAKRLIGYSCRAMFHCLLEVLLELKPGLVVGITPLQHTSFRNIVENLVPAENIHVLRVDAALRAVLPLERRCDVLVVTHVFGQDLDMSALNCVRGVGGAPLLVVEDRCQGGTLKQPFSHERVDIAINSMGMDKRPCALGGGFLDLRDGALAFEGRPLLRPLIARVVGLPRERPAERLKSLLKKVPNWLLYNFRAVQRPVYILVDALTYAGLADGITSFGAAVRKVNPGFEHHNYMKRPSAALRKMIVAQLGEWRATEERIAARHAVFLAALGADAAREYMPWLREDASGAPQPNISVYNSVVVDARRADAFAAFAKRRGLLCIPNPTYVCPAANADAVTNGLVARLYYVACLSGISDASIRALAAHLLDFRRSILI